MCKREAFHAMEGVERASVDMGQKGEAVDRTRPGQTIESMSQAGQNGREFFQFLAMLAIVALIVSAVGAGFFYVRHERQAGSAANQLRRIDEEAKKAGWVKAADGTWSLPDSGATNVVSASHPAAGGTNKPGLKSLP